MDDDRNRLLIFAKAPIAGDVKTRLQPLLNAQQSTQLHRRLVEHGINTAMLLDNVKVQLWIGGDHGWWQELSQQYGIEVFHQRGADLGDRMLNAFERALAYSDNVVLIGTDCPFISRDYLNSAFNALAEKDVVLGPAEDGGYVLVGLKTPLPALFNNITWGSDQVLDQTRQQLMPLGIVAAELTTLMDIDRPEDFKHLQTVLPALVAGLGPIDYR